MVIKSSDTNVNALCQKCIRACRQPASVVLCECKRFRPYPFKIPSHSFDQIDLFSEDGPDSDNND